VAVGLPRRWWWWSQPVGGSRVDEDEGVWVDGIPEALNPNKQTTNKQTIALSEFGSDNIQTNP